MSSSGPCVVFVSKVNDTLKTIDTEITKINGDHQFCFTLFALHMQYICIVYFAVHTSNYILFIILTAQRIVRITFLLLVLKFNDADNIGIVKY